LPLGAMDKALIDWCTDNGFANFLERLSELGVTGFDDIECLEDDDFFGIGMGVKHIGRLRGAPEGDCGTNHGRKTSNRSSFAAVANGCHPELAPSASRLNRKSSCFWQGQCNRPLRLIFIRHGESEANVDREITKTVPDHLLHLTTKGRQQALEAGERLRGIIGEESTRFVVSPYTRTRETLNGVLQAFGPDRAGEFQIQEDVRMREQEFGNLDSPDMPKLHREKKEFGAFYYRFPSGESAADCYDRASLFLETMYRAWERNEAKNQVVVSHGMMILVTLMRFLRMEVDVYEDLEPLKNCEFVVLERPADDPLYSIAFAWPAGEEKHMGDLRTKPTQGEKLHRELWNGDPAAPLLSSRNVPEPAC